jgi:hypothetical protein
MKKKKRYAIRTSGSPKFKAEKQISIEWMMKKI